MSGILALVVGGYALGVLPLAWLVVRRRGHDLSTAGSGNVGANNAYRSTGSKALGVGVLLVDALKGVAAVLLGWVLWDTGAVATGRFWSGTIPLLAAVAGHNYNAVLSLRAGRLVGGKGLATVAGGFALVAPDVLLAWLLLFALGLWLSERAWGRREVIAGNVTATALVPFAAALIAGASAALAAAVFAGLSLPKHARQFQALLAQPRTEPSKNR